MLGSTDLLGVARADGGDHVRTDDARLQEVQVPVKLEQVMMKMLPIQAGPLEGLGRELPLVGQVVNRHHGGGILESCVDRRVRFDQCRDQTALPIVAMDDVRRPSNATHRLNGSPTEKRESLSVVGVIAGGRSVE